MSRQSQPLDAANLPYKPRRQRSARPERPLPAVPPPDEDVPIENAFEAAQHFRSPPSPPPPPPPPRPADRGSHSNSSDDTTAGPKKASHHLHAYHSSLPAPDDLAKTPLSLTPLRAHYLKKTLVNLQMAHELNLLTDPVLGANALGLLGDPFVLPDAARKDALARVSEVARQEGSSIGDLPFLRFLFHQFLLPFPFLSSATPTFWSGKVQPFLSSFLATTGYSSHATMTEEERRLSESLMTKDERKEADERAKIWAKTEKHMGLMVGVGMKLVGGEEVVRINQGDLRRLEEIQQERMRKAEERRRLQGVMTFEVNVVGVRVVVEKGRVRNRSHDEFLIRTRRTGVQDVYVSRRYGDFKRLSDELRTSFPDYPLPPPPPKDKSATTAAPVAPSPAQYSYYNPLRAIYGSAPAPSSGTSSPTPGSGFNPNDSSESLSSPNAASFATTPLSREKNRLTLRAYLQGILGIPHVINSPIVRSFLLSNPTTLSAAEAADSQRRLEGDAVREEGRRRFRAEAEKRIEGLRNGLAQFKGDVLSKDGGLKSVFDVVKRVERVEDLPTAEASVLEWGRISLAATIFQLFVASDTASDTLAALKRLHGMMPYMLLKGILKVSNPMAMIRGVLDLFLARPFGGQSLIQKMFSSSLTEDVRYIAEDITMVSEKIDDPVLCQKIEQFAMAPFEIQEFYRKDAATEGLDLLVVILRSPDMPSLSRPQFQRVFRASRAYKQYKAAQEELEDSDDDMGPDNEDAWLFEDLTILLKLWMRRREKEQLLALIFEGVTAELLKDIITIFYAPLAQVYKAASIADSLSDLQTFLNDMIRTVEQVEEASSDNPQRTVQTFIDLVQRHEQSFYTFVHNVHSKGQGLFDSLMSWIELFLSYARSGLPQPIDMEFILPASGAERERIMKEVDSVAQYHYKLKVAHEEKLRRRFDGSVGVEEDELLSGVMESLSLGDIAAGEAREIEDEEEEGESDDDEADEEEEEEDARAFRDAEGGEGGGGFEHEMGSLSVQSPPTSAGGSRRSSDNPPEAPDEITNPNLPSLSPNQAQTPGQGKDRRGSGSFGKMDKLRHPLGNKDKDKDRKRDKDGGKSQPTPTPPPSAARVDQRGSRRRGKDRRRRMEVLNQPETKAIEELRPLFVEMIRPMLKVKKLQS